MGTKYIRQYRCRYSINSQTIFVFKHKKSIFSHNTYAILLRKLLDLFLIFSTFPFLTLGKIL